MKAAPEQFPTLSVVVPAYNESARILRTLEEIVTYFEKEPGFLIEILVCDDGSRDATPALVRAFDDPRVYLLRTEENLGKGVAVRRGVLAASGSRILIADADLSTPIAEYPVLAARLSVATPVVIGSRYLSHRGIVQPWTRRLSGMTFGALARLVLGLRCSDTQCGFKLFTRDAGRFLFERSHINGFAFDAEILFIAAIHGMEVAEVPVRWVHDQASKIRIARESWRMGRDLIRILARRRAYRDQGGAGG